MPTLTLRFKGKNLRRFRFKQGTAITIGRSKKNHVVIDNLAVSNHHAKIDSVGHKYLLTDLKSKNGTFVNEKSVSLQWLSHGDIITIAKHSLLFAFAEGERNFVRDDSIQDRPIITDVKQYTRITASNAEPAVSVQKAEKSSIGVLAFLNGGQGEIELIKKLTRIGKSPDSDIVINGLMVGKTAFTISKRDNGYYLSYVGGILKPKVNGDIIKDTIRLKEFDTINIGITTFQFFENN